MKSSESRKDTGSNGASRHSTDKLSEALQILDEAAAEKKEEVRTLVTEKFHNLKETFDSLEPEIQKVGSTVVAFANRVGHASSDEVKHAINKVNTDAHDRPWPYVGAAALTGFLVGLLVAKK